jgi:hypothetical protein
MSKGTGMSLVAASVPLACLLLIVWRYWHQLFLANTVSDSRPLLWWISRGLVLPVFGWIALNIGFSATFPPLIPEIALAKSAGRSWLPLAMKLSAPGVIIIGSFWAAVSFIYLLTEIAIRIETRDARNELLFLAIVIGLLALPFVALVGWAGRWPMSGLAALIWLVPLTHCTVSLASQPPSLPCYSSAIARMKFGKSKEAELSVINELEKCESDFEGWMLLAELYATRFGDLAEADQTIRAVCDQPSTTPFQISIAFHRLADWHLNLTDNPPAARRALEEIGRRLPGGHFAKMAQLRLRQLPATRREWLEQRKPKPISLPALNESLSEPNEPRQPPTDRSAALRLADELVEKLKQDPNDVATREKLALAFADQLGKPDLAIEQLELLMGMPDQPASDQARWLSLIAAWHLRHGRDMPAAKRILERLIREHAQSAEAFAAQRRLNLIEMEELSARPKLATAVD